jgi:hypothetical protein
MTDGARSNSPPERNDVDLATRARNLNINITELQHSDLAALSSVRVFELLRENLEAVSIMFPV